MTQQYFIQPQYINLSKDGVKILELLGLKISIPSASDIQPNNIKICDVDFSTRAATVLRTLLWDNPNWNIMTISDFVSEYTEQDIRKCRNCGKKTIKSIKEVLYTYGFELSTKRGV